MFLGELAGQRSPVHTFTPLLGAQLDVDPGGELTLDIDATWNFVGQSHQDITAYRQQDHDDRFGAVQGYRGAVSRLPAPALPNATLRPRPNSGV